MALNDTGMRVPTEIGENAKAIDDAGNTVIVSASHEAIQDYGWSTILEAAWQKFAAGEIEPNSNPPRVRVVTGDCA